MQTKLIQFAAAAGLLFAASGAHAQTFTVTNCNDTGAGSLRAVAESAPDGAVVAMDALPCNRIVLRTGPIRLRQPVLQIQGPGLDKLTVSGDGRSQVFVHAPPADAAFTSLALRRFTVSWGRALDGEAFGGCISTTGGVSLQDMQVHHCLARDSRSGGDAGYGGAVYGGAGVVLTHSIVHTNRADGGDGGGVYSGGPISVNNSRVSNNQASGNGGGFVALEGAHVELSNVTSNVAGGVGGGMWVDGTGQTDRLITIMFSTIARNRAHTAAGAYFSAANSTRLIESTVSGNVADESQGGVVFDAGYMTQEVINSTITANRALAPGAAGCLGSGASVRMRLRLNSSIVSANTCAGMPDDLASVDDPGATGALGNNNLLGAINLVFTGNGTVRTNSPRLGALAFNGGVTETHLPLADSPVIDKGNNSPGFATDQRRRNFVRVKGAAADIGAVER
ncbi:hypothetical protein LYSHEL_26570 [Lysobacter helvus]|uniref:Right-handed parallel beta-helix repeat-containing protein n=2 Tax=Lysobacteraceae TaxID=32033 RepID=A0ABN6G106_9GAMM|nr:MULTISPECIES: choice-of-anchor Q domain-containing protein [Lysobacter]BCT93632.1 hypothetical protein LYSCAS_26560 [Lysobacter caseinilyticus]BCT96786.1 hypothetical protein LYSHEL_26570 [Lysobacter helvus]